ncbi:ATP-binding protein [Streptomyces paludis]|nr:ATP-binding protein [Streptomyces paludis]
MTAEDAQLPGDMRRTCTQQIAQWGLSHLTDAVGILVSELVTNAVKYGAGNEVRLRMWRTWGSIWLEVWDGSADLPRTGDPGWGATSGRGLLIVDYLVGECGGQWGVTKDGTATWCELPVRPAAA